MAIDLTRADLIKGLSELISEIKRTQRSNNNQSVQKNMMMEEEKRAH